MRYKIILSISLLILVSPFLYSQKIITTSDRYRPSWIDNSVRLKKYNETYSYHVVLDAGQSLNTLRESELVALSNYLQHTNRIEGVIDRKVNAGTNDYSSSIGLSYKTNTSVEEFTCKKIDSYWVQQKIAGSGLQFTYYSLYAVAHSSVSDFDEYNLTEKYGAIGLWRSMLVPGWGQMHKGAYAKGGVILGGTVALAGGIIFTENMRQSCLMQMSQTHSAPVIKQLSANMTNWSVGRNVCIGAVAALYIYNLVDAVVAPGARRVVVTPGYMAVRF